uniref:Fe2OG dioxygenase domain-containing protein n=1 Tax=Aureoumbra lagunensis TaxID=44058 RepID=A0A7S3JXT1_9STRA|mmetsp:Transcript_4211/g.5924  ORF Transcript_4211/g.5924 Transcript_4211/m.5924 type:complete len:540 (+) Transcript_4211:66-1685(+)|eukprot:CAMPEP_0197296060 /NCGR_PEP_ID=MMETSP0890-20130614/37358_1 /TAXON_ID=44058 ORGANISM="Aureoumbra lagunensis, Strain CCMP1510" /NCGR_SAMPLE_ID=MMETSP0890 /ASSEMBLY_ACC=CAM_ASM_000533 /LENGTH=539 /DNA_ID=CAMNT_0042772383 /DNA_START=57 /DNA_END=1676 /DNA_ORIENTATION=+
MVLRSSVHTLQKGVRRRHSSDPPQEGLLALPYQVRKLTYVSIPKIEDLICAIREILADSDLGTFCDESKLSSFWTDMNEDYEKCLEKQRLLTSSVARSKRLSMTYEALVREHLAPWLQRRLALFGLDETRIFYQRPPTLRIHVSGTGAKVKCHNDCAYGHQPGELNFWMPLSDCPTTLWVESAENKNDFKPLETKPGIAAVFFGSKCRHYVPENDSGCTRVSLDFRLAPASCFDPYWQLKGTIADHDRGFIDLPPYCGKISNAVDCLLVHGYVSMPLPTLVSKACSQCFELFPTHEAFSDCPEMSGLNGYHNANGLGGFNKYREGCIFQNTTEAIWPMHQDNTNHLAFANAMETMRFHCIDFATSVLSALASRLNMPEDFFLNEFDVISESQFHLKRLTGLTREMLNEDYDAVPAHVDPSLISLLIHNDNSGGFQVVSRGEYIRHPHIGPHSCCLLVGSILHLLAPNVPTCKHRVRPRESDLDNRLAITFFLQPKSNTRLIPLARLGLGEEEAKELQNYPDYASWKQRAYSTYLKKERS